jgi:hypothetical protein
MVCLTFAHRASLGPSASRPAREKPHAAETSRFASVSALWRVTFSHGSACAGVARHISGELLAQPAKSEAVIQDTGLGLDFANDRELRSC